MKNIICDKTSNLDSEMLVATSFKNAMSVHGYS